MLNVTETFFFKIKNKKVHSFAVVASWVMGE